MKLLRVGRDCRHNFGYFTKAICKSPHFEPYLGCTCNILRILVQSTEYTISVLSNRQGPDLSFIKIAAKHQSFPPSHAAFKVHIHETHISAKKN